MSRLLKNMTNTLADELREQAADERRAAKQLEGCSFIGQHPATPHKNKARLLEQAAIIMEIYAETQYGR